MTYLFRAYSDDSQGTNTPALFASGAATAHIPINIYIPPKHNDSQLGQQLKDALAWKKKSPSPFIFWTASLFFAVQVARVKSRNGERNVYIAVLDIRTAKTPLGGKVSFTSVPIMLQERGIRLERKGGVEKGYRDVFATLDCVVPGSGSRVASIELLEDTGLCRLYPVLGWGYEPGNGRTRLNRNTEDFRAFHFAEEQGLTMERMGVAARLASVFVAAGRENVEAVDATILAHLLAFRKRSSMDPMLAMWTLRNTIEVFQLDDDEGEDMMANEIIEAVDLEEVKQSVELKRLLKDKQILPRALASTVGGISQHEIDAEKQNWTLWSQQQRLDYIAKREAQPDFDSNFKRREPRPPRSSPNSNNMNIERDASYVERRASKLWLPREQYEAAMAARNVQRGRARREGSKKTRSTALRAASHPKDVVKQKSYGTAALKRAR